MFSSIIYEVGSHFHSEQVNTTGIAFKFLTRVTVNILLLSAVLISLEEYFGEPINCQAEREIKQFIETKCWIEGVYIDKKLLFGTIGKEITRYGVGSSQSEEDFIHQAYYQWIIPTLLLMALILYIPRVLWKVWENGIMSNLLKDADFPIITDEWDENKTILLRFLKELPTKYHRYYAFKYFFCQILSCGTLFFNMFIMHKVFNNFWVEYRPAIAALLDQDFTRFSQNSAKLFPTQAKCFYYDFGPSGTQQKQDALCFLPQNTINEKIFVFLYFWFIAMVVVAVLSLVHSIAMLSMKSFRCKDIRGMTQGKRPSKNFLRFNSDVGYWFVLCLIRKNLSSALFNDMISDLIELSGKKK